jgi:hypothetical protein
VFGQHDRRSVRAEDEDAPDPALYTSGTLTSNGQPVRIPVTCRMDLATDGTASVQSVTAVPRNGSTGVTFGLCFGVTPTEGASFPSGTAALDGRVWSGVSTTSSHVLYAIVPRDAPRTWS